MTTIQKASAATLPGLLALFFLYVNSIPSDTRLGPTSVAGVLTGMIAGLSLALFPWLITLRERRHVFDHQPWVRWLPAIWWFFLLWAVISLGRLFTIDGAQNLAVWISFSFAVCAGAITTTPETVSWLLRNIRRAAWMTAVVYAATVAIDGPGTNILFGARAYAWTALIFIAVLIAAPAKTKGNTLLPVFLVLMIGLTLSRTALALGLLLLVAIVLRGRRGTRAFKASLILGGAAYASWEIVNKYEPLRKRFFEGDDAFQIGGVHLNTSGRMAFWEKLWDSAMIDPWFGRGLGSSVTVTSQYYASFGTTQPHNDYIRLLHDLGWLGVIMFTVALLAVLRDAIGRASKAKTPLSRQIHTAAALSLGVVLIAMITDNMIIYPFVMIPVGVLLGVSIGTGSADTRSRTPGLKAQKIKEAAARE